MPSAIVKNSKGLRDRLKQKILVTPRYEKETLLEQEFVLNISSLLVIKCRSRIAYFRKFIIIIVIIINIIDIIKIIAIIIIIFTERKFLKGQFEREKLLLKEESFIGVAKLRALRVFALRWSIVPLVCILSVRGSKSAVGFKYEQLAFKTASRRISSLAWKLAMTYFSDFEKIKRLIFYLAIVFRVVDI